MPGKGLPDSDSTSPATPEQGQKAWLGARVDADTRDEVNQALQIFGIDNPAEGLRLVMKAFARSAGVRDAVRESLHLAVLDQPREPAA